MATIKPFVCVRPKKELASRVAALPYDVYSRQEACRVTRENPLSFLNIDRAETQFPDDVDTYDDKVYEKARELLQSRIADGTWAEDGREAYYIYELTMEGRTQSGIVACSSVDDYLTGMVKKHENTREDKEIDRIRHVDVTDAQTGPIFLAYRSCREINDIVRGKESEEPLYDFVSDDKIRHRVWKIGEEETVRKIGSAFERVPCTYIADGHHRAASAVKVALKRRMENPGYTGNEPFNYFLSVLFPDDQLMIMPYNRVVKDLRGMDESAFLDSVSSHFKIIDRAGEPLLPKEKGTFGLCLKSGWYLLGAKPECRSDDPVKGLDVSILQDCLLEPVLGIGDPRTDTRIEFVGGIRGAKELERRVAEDMAAAFAMYPTSIEELFSVADAGLLMPPKSTWFEPKLRSGLFIHKLS